MNESALKRQNLTDHSISLTMKTKMLTEECHYIGERYSAMGAKFESFDISFRCLQSETSMMCNFRSRKDFFLGIGNSSRRTILGLIIWLQSAVLILRKKVLSCRPLHFYIKTDAGTTFSKQKFKNDNIHA